VTLHDRRPLIWLALLFVLSAGLHIHRAANPTSSYQSADERSYGKLAVDIADQGHYGSPSTGMRDPLHWPPGAPLLFAVGHQIAPDEASRGTFEIPSAYALQALVSLGTVLAAFGLAWAVAGMWPGVIAAGLVGLYPPLVLATGEQVSEPLGAFFLTCAFAALALSAAASRLWGYLGAGLLFGFAVLTRADLLFVPFLVAVLTGLWYWRTADDVRRGFLKCVLVAAGALVVMTPWIAYASNRSGQLVPVTKGSAPPLFVGTFLPGHGHTVGMKRALEREVKEFNPELRAVPAFEIEAGEYMELIAARHPDLNRDSAIRLEARKNIRKYATEDPVGFAGMMLGKVQRMWGRYARGGARHTSWAIRIPHILLVLGGFVGILLGLRHRRGDDAEDEDGSRWSPRVALGAVLVAAVTSTALHMLVVSQARYNLPLMPGLIAGGVAGWALWLHARRPENEEGRSSVTALEG
jgi:4-amino-4-deoxy-L-arabinose transferase-like glycosyltransferase